jgi:hypothetical protein
MNGVNVVFPKVYFYRDLGFQYPKGEFQMK